MPLRDGVTAFVIVRNELDNIGLCLSSLYGHVDEILLIDDESNDRREKLKEQYQYWMHVFSKSGTWMTVAYEPHRGFHHRHFPLVDEMVKTKWMFGLDGDEILRASHGFQMREFIKSVDDKISAIGCMMHESVDDGSKIVHERSYPKYRLYRKDRGHFNTIEHGEFVIDSGSLGFIEHFHLDHIRTNAEKQIDAERYKAEVINQYKLATTDDKRKYFADLYKSQAEYYKWDKRTIEEI